MAPEMISAARSAAGGTTPSPWVENAGALEVDLTADPNWCDHCRRVHQERERAVPCVVCQRRWTGRYHAVCEVCET